MFVIVRTTNAGVHCGDLGSQNGQKVVLDNARRIWRWRGANTLNELSQNGCDFGWSRISEPVPTIMLLDAIEIIECSAKASTNLSQSRWSTQ